MRDPIISTGGVPEESVGGEKKSQDMHYIFAYTLLHTLAACRLHSSVIDGCQALARAHAEDPEW